MKNHQLNSNTITLPETPEPEEQPTEEETTEEEGQE
jgi:hypothetical protein